MEGKQAIVMFVFTYKQTTLKSLDVVDYCLKSTMKTGDGSWNKEEALVPEL